MTDLEGSRVGRYLLKDFLGRGGMAEVYRAEDTVLARSVAIKLILPAFASDPAFLERFLREAQLVASLDHPHVVPVYDFGEEDGRPFLVMPYIPGGSLASRLSGRPIPMARSAAWLHQLGSALDAAHAAGVLHRDVKPANVLLGRDERLLLSDFGIARALESSTRLTATGVLVGTPAFMAPELAEGEAATAASDRYALGVLAFQLLTGETPYAGESALAVLHQHVNTPVPEVTERNPELPIELNQVMRRLLAKQPVERPGSGVGLAHELAEAFPPEEQAAFRHEVVGTEIAPPVGGHDSGATAATLARGDMESAPTVLEHSAPAPRPNPTAALPSPPLPERPRESMSRRALWVALILAVGITAGAILVKMWPPETEDETPSEATVAQLPEPDADSSTLGPVPETSPAAVEGVGPEKEDEPLSSADPSLSGTDSPPTRPAAAAGGQSAVARQSVPRLRRPPRRLSRGDFQRWADTSSPEETLQRIYGEGGLGYLDGDGQRAMEAIKKLGEIVGRHPQLAESWPFNFLRSRQHETPLEVALFYGDAKGEARDLLHQELKNSPRDARLRFGLAFVEHLDGRHETASEMLSQMWERGARARGGNAGSFRLAQFIALEYLDLGRLSDAIEWASRGLEGAGPLAGPFVQEVLARLEEEGASRAVWAGFRRKACEMGVPAGCEASRDKTRTEPRRKAGEFPGLLC